MSHLKSKPPAVSELVVASRRVARELNEHSLTRRQDALFALAKKAISSSDQVRPLLIETAGIVADALHAVCGAFTAPTAQANQWRLALVSPTSQDAHLLDETNLNGDAEGSLIGRVSMNQSPLSVEEILEEARPGDTILLERGLRSGLLCPLLNQMETLGVLGVFDDEPRAFERSDLRFVETVAQWLALIIGKVQVERQLDEARQMATAFSQTVNALLIELSPQGMIQWANECCADITGFDADELKDRTLWNALLIPNEVSIVKGIISRLATERDPIDFDCHLLTKHGERRRMAWSCCGVRSSDGVLLKLLATGLDVTDKLQAEYELKQLRRQVEGDDGEVLPCSALDAPLAEPKSRRKKRADAVPAVDVEVPADSDRSNRRGAAPATEGTADSLSGRTTYVGRERRSRARNPYPYKQLMAPMYPDELPPLHTFCEVQCREISSAGFSFTLPAPPSYDAVVVAFGTGSALIYLSASIQHVTRIMVRGKAQYVVGCRYLGRVSYNKR